MNEIDFYSHFADEGLTDWPEDDCENIGWPGDGSGEDDLADFNANEANDYLNE